MECKRLLWRRQRNCSALRRLPYVPYVVVRPLFSSRLAEALSPRATDAAGRQIGALLLQVLVDRQRADAHLASSGTADVACDHLDRAVRGLRVGRVARWAWTNSYVIASIDSSVPAVGLSRVEAVHTLVQSMPCATARSAMCVLWLGLLSARLGVAAVVNRVPSGSPTGVAKTARRRMRCAHQ